jgi:6-phosphofructokinase
MGDGRVIKRVGMLFSGGPAPAANAVISAAAMNFLNCGVEVVGFMDGYEDLEQYSLERPLVENEHYLCLTIDDVSGIRNRKDIILRTSRANPGRGISSLDDLKDPAKNGKVMAVYRALESMRIDGLVSIGGDDTLKTANYVFALQQVVPGLRPISVIHLPKTIDNDYYGIDWTFGFNSAVDFAAREIQNVSADAKSTKTWYVLELMGRKAGWLTYAAGIAGEATRMVSVEDFDDVFDIEAFAIHLVELMRHRAENHREYGVICVA